MDYTLPYNQWIPLTSSELALWTKSFMLRSASYLTDPVCKAREYFVRSRILDDLEEASPRVVDFLRQVASLPFSSALATEEMCKRAEFYYLRAGTLSWGILGVFTAPLGLALRAIVASTSYGPLHYRGSYPEEALNLNKGYKLLFRNICGIKGGYDIEEGAQMPIRDDLNYPQADRIESQIKQFQEIDAQVLCLNEVFDINDAHYIANALQNQYSHFVMNCGPRAIGPNSGLFFACKCPVLEAQFFPFPKEFLVGEAKNCEKGVLLVKTIDTSNKVTVCALTHGQHSDQVEHPNEEERQARHRQIDFIMGLVSSEEQLVLLGDLNMDDQELGHSSYEKVRGQFSKALEYRNQSKKEEYTWGGDAWYVGFGNRTASSPTWPSAAHRTQDRIVSCGLNIDHVMVSNRGMSIVSLLLEDPVPYDPTKISRDTLSDHRAILSVIRKKQEKID